MKRLLLLFCLFILPFFFFSCSEEGSSFYYDVVLPPVNLDPQSAADQTSFLVIQNIYEGLVTLDESGEPVLGIAESCVIRDGGLTYIFTLKDGLRWSDGSELTSADVLFAFSRLFDESTRSPYVSDFFMLENAREVLAGEKDFSALGIKAKDDRTVVFSLSNPDDGFLRLLSTAAAMPCNEEFFTGTRGKYGLYRNMVLGNGAFYISSWQDSYITLRKNKEYSGAGGVTSDFVRVNFLAELKDGKTAWERFLAGETSAVVCNGEEITESSQWSAQGKQNTVWALAFSENSRVMNADLRKALAYSCDLSRLEKVLPGYLSAAQNFMPGDIKIGSRCYKDIAKEDLRLPYSPEAASGYLSAALEEIDISDLASVSLLVPEGSGGEEYLSYLIQGWQKELHLYFSIELLSQEDYDARLAQGDFDCALVSFSGDNGQAGLFSSLFADPTKKLLVPASQEFFTALQKGEASLDEEEQAEFYLQAEKLMLQKAAVLPLYHETTYFLQAKGVSGLRYNFDTGLLDFKYGIIS